MLKPLRPTEPFNVIFPELAEGVTDEDFIRWKKEIDLIWTGYDVEWIRIADRVWGIKCHPKQQKESDNDNQISGEFGFGPN